MSITPKKNSFHFADNKHNALQNLIDVTDILDAHHCTHWLSDGTLLGAIREGDFISHDTDLDIAVMADQFTPAVVHDMINCGFEIFRSYGTYEKGLFITFVRGGVSLDTFLYYKDTEHQIRSSCWHQASIGRSTRVDYTYPEQELRKREFLGHKFWMPENPEQILEIEYGPDWRTPEPNWNGITSPYNKKYTRVTSFHKRDEAAFLDWLGTSQQDS